jgi:hypothetical protein
LFSVKYFSRYFRSLSITKAPPQKTLDNTTKESTAKVKEEKNERQESSQGEVEECFTVNTHGVHVRKSIYTVPDFLKDPGNNEFQQTSNRRLLLNCQNPLHVINGVEYRYYLGIVDFFTRFECRQQMARIMKTVKFLSSNHSTVHPNDYAERFLKFITERTTDL